ncbi:MAG: hypothetical protein IH624_11035 [Phycisphaerae bacterium]|nr:hypothetical protein [Phycisphaerae bacterium]
MPEMSVLIDEGLRLAFWLLPGLVMVVVLLLVFSTVDRRHDARKKAPDERESPDRRSDRRR